YSSDEYSDNGREPCALELEPSCVWDNVCGVCWYRGHHGGGRLVWCHGLRRGTAEARNRHTHGARCASTSSVVADFEAWRHPARRWTGPWPCRRARCWTTPPKSSRPDQAG